MSLCNINVNFRSIGLCRPMLFPRSIGLCFLFLFIIGYSVGCNDPVPPFNFPPFLPLPFLSPPSYFFPFSFPVTSSVPSRFPLFFKFISSSCNKFWCQFCNLWESSAEVSTQAMPSNHRFPPPRRYPLPSNSRQSINFRTGNCSPFRLLQVPGTQSSRFGTRQGTQIIVGTPPPGVEC